MSAMGVCVSELKPTYFKYQLYLVAERFLVLRSCLYFLNHSTNFFVPVRRKSKSNYCSSEDNGLLVHQLQIIIIILFIKCHLSII